MVHHYCVLLKSMTILNKRSKTIEIQKQHTLLQIDLAVLAN